MRPHFLMLVFLIGQCTATYQDVPSNFRLNWEHINPLAPPVNLDNHHHPTLLEVRKQLQCMHKMIYYYDNGPAITGDHSGEWKKLAQGVIHDAFGATPNIKKIKTMMEDLLSAEVIMFGDNAANVGDASHTFAITDPAPRYLGPGKVLIYRQYHLEKYLGRTMGDIQRAHVLMHEATHALFKTWDHWHGKLVGDKVHVTPLTAELRNLHVAAVKKRDNKEALSDIEKSHILEPQIAGYWHEAYLTLRDVISSNMHINADSWPVFGYRCVYKHLPTPRDLTKDKPEPESVVW